MYSKIAYCKKYKCSVWKWYENIQNLHIQTVKKLCKNVLISMCNIFALCTYIKCNKINALFCLIANYIHFYGPKKLRCRGNCIICSVLYTIKNLDVFVCVRQFSKSFNMLVLLEKDKRAYFTIVSFIVRLIENSEILFLMRRKI